MTEWRDQADTCSEVGGVTILIPPRAMSRNRQWKALKRRPWAKKTPKGISAPLPSWYVADTICGPRKRNTQKHPVETKAKNKNSRRPCRRRGGAHNPLVTSVKENETARKENRLRGVEFTSYEPSSTACRCVEATGWCCGSRTFWTTREQHCCTTLIVKRPYGIAI